MKHSILIILQSIAVSCCWWVNLNNVKLSHLNELKQRDSVEVYLSYQNFVRDSLMYDIDVFIQNEKTSKRIKQHYFQNR